MKLTIGIPAYNEEKNIASVITKLQKIADQIIVCDDGSSDNTAVIAEKLGANVISHNKNLGYGAAIRSIFLKSRELDVEILVTFDADGQHRIEDIQTVIQPILENKSDIVIGSRFLNNKSEIPRYRKIGIKTITKLTNSVTGKKITDSQSGFRAYNKKTIEVLNPSDYGMGISTEILIKANKKNLRISEVPITVLYEGDTSTHHPVSHGVSVLLSTMKFISIENPLKFYGISGAIFLIVGLFFTVWTIQIYSETNQIITNITLIGIGTTLVGVMLLVTAIILFSLVNVVRENR